MAVYFMKLRCISGYGSRSLATFKMEFFAVLVNDRKLYDGLYYNRL